MQNYKISILVILVTFISCQYKKGPKVQDKTSLPAEVLETIENRVAEDEIPSIALALIDSTGINYYNFGKTAVDGHEVNENTIYEIGSITKVFTGIILAKQVLDGNLKIDDRINELLPDSINIPVFDDNEITLGNLTDHTSGFPTWPDNVAPENPNNPFADYTVAQMYEFIANYQPVREAGSEYEYSNIAQGLLGHLLASKSNTTYEKLMIKTIADPLEMDNTRIEFTKRMKENLALGHNDGKVVENWDMPILAGMGAIRSSTSDMARFISANLGYINTPIDEAMKLSHKVRHNKAAENSVAMAWHIKKGENGDVIWHNGSTAGYNAFAGFVKETGRGIVILSNSSISVDDIGFYYLETGSELEKIKLKSSSVKLPETTLEKYVGEYELQPDFKLTVTKEGSKLFVQDGGGEKIEIYAENDTIFFATMFNAEITFQLKEGIVESLTLYQKGQKIKGKKIIK